MNNEKIKVYPDYNDIPEEERLDHILKNYFLNCNKKRSIQIADYIYKKLTYLKHNYVLLKYNESHYSFLKNKFINKNIEFYDNKLIFELQNTQNSIENAFEIVSPHGRSIKLWIFKED